MGALVRPLVAVTWDDAHGSATVVYDEARLHKPMVMTTVGWLMKSDKRGVSLVCEQCQDDDAISHRGHTFIPRGIIRKVTKLRHP